MERRLDDALTHLLRLERKSRAVSENRGGQIVAEQRQTVAHSANCGILFYDQSSSGMSGRNFTNGFLSLLRSLASGKFLSHGSRRGLLSFGRSTAKNVHTHLLRAERRSRAVSENRGRLAPRPPYFHSPHRHRSPERRKIP